MSRQPSISVVICAMNDERFIARTITSALSQGYERLQVHVQLSRRTTDRTREIVEGFPVQLRVEEDSGVPDALNRGFMATAGEACIFLGADDPLLPGSLQVLADALTAHPSAGFVYGDIEYIDAYDQPFQRQTGRAFDVDEMFWYNWVPTQSVAVRREALREVGMYRTGIINADWDLWIRLGARFPSVYLASLLAQYRVHDGSNSLNNLRQMAADTRAVTDSLLSRHDVRAALRRGEARARAGGYLWASQLYTLANAPDEARRLLSEAIGGYPRAAVTKRGIIAGVASLLGAKRFASLRRRGRAPG
jgi:hypothetical protein